MKLPFVSRSKYDKLAKSADKYLDNWQKSGVKLLHSRMSEERLSKRLEYYENKYGLPQSYDRAWQAYQSGESIRGAAGHGNVPYTSFWKYVKRKEGRNVSK